MVPEALLLAVLAATGAVAPWLALVAIGASAVLGLSFALMIGRAWQTRAERLQAVAEALEARKMPPHLLSDEGDVMSHAERRMLDAADSVVDEIDRLEEQRDEFETILRNMTEAVVVTRSRGEVVLVNAAARKLFALEPETDYTGRLFVELCRDPQVQNFVANSMRTGGSAPNGGAGTEIMIQKPTPRYLGASAAPLMTSHGAAWVLVFHDITQLKAYETARSDFIANLTHELRTPLSALYGYAETLINGVDDAETHRRFLGIIDRQARRLARLLDDLIVLSDLERGLTPLKLEALHPRDVVEEAVELMGEHARREGVVLAAQCEEHLPDLNGDRDRLHQVMINLLDNAIKYTPRGGHVTVYARRAELNGAGGPRPAIALAVADTGEGIPERDIPRLTERFYRVDRARSRELGGTGLGLAIVKHIVQLHNGALKIDSKLGEGTTVTLSIPAQTAT
jgi:two-component system, OmpR family, phosphate regulon sensor histidine kinase PhoR